MHIEIGTAKEDITCFIPGLGMMGYGQMHNVVKEIATPLWARVLMIEDSGHYHIWVHLELAFVTLAIKDEVLNQLKIFHPEWKITYDNLIITAQHTHSAPGGYSHYPLYNFTIPGFQTKVFSKITTSIIKAIDDSFKTKKTCQIFWGKTEIDSSHEVAFNRSIEAHNRNPESQKLNKNECHLAVDRSMEGLFFKDLDGKIIAFLNWFGVHCTSISSFNHRIHHDNKGIAAELFEKKHPGSIALFLQSAAGDVSPNFIWDKKRKLMRGKFADQYDSAAYNGQLQFRASEKISPDLEISGEIKSKNLFYNLSQNVAPAAHGVSFLQGTAEGPGISKALGFLLKGWSQTIKFFRCYTNPEKHLSYYQAHGNKSIILDHRRGEFIGLGLRFWKNCPPLPDQTLENLRKTARANALETSPWAPPILPFGLLRLGEILIAFVPGEITFIASERLKLSLKNQHSPFGVKIIIVTSYANAFMGYITTPQEYDHQSYEGGHTIFGRETLKGVIEAFQITGDHLNNLNIHTNIDLLPFTYPAEELSRRSF